MLRYILFEMKGVSEIELEVPSCIFEQGVSIKSIIACKKVPLIKNVNR